MAAELFCKPIVLCSPSLHRRTTTNTASESRVGIKELRIYNNNIIIISQDGNYPIKIKAAQVGNLLWN